MNRSTLARLGFTALAVALATTTVITPARAAAETGIVSGQFTTDDGTPIEGATVEVLSPSDWDPFGRATTDAQGQFTIRHVRPGTVKIRFDKTRLIQWATRQTDYSEATEFTVTAGQTLTVNERLLPTGIITGRIVDADQQPVTWRPIFARGAEPLQTWPSGYTDDEGRYTLRVWPGQYRIYFPHGTIEQWAHQTWQAGSATKYTVAAGQTVVVDHTLLPTGTVGGRLVETSGKPIAGASVNLKTGEHPPGWATTNDNGEFSFPSVAPGAYKVSFTLRNGTVQWAHGKRTEAEAEAISVTAGQHTTVDETLLATGAVAGRFTDQNGAGMPDVTVSVTADVDGETSHYAATTDDQGNYRVNTVTVGRYVVRFRDPQTGRVQYAYGKGSEQDADPITVRAGETATVNDQQVPAGRLRITATDAATGAPLSDFCVMLHGPSSAHNCATGTELTVDDLAEGQYGMHVSPAEGSLHLGVETTARVTPGHTTAVPLALRPGGAIRATVTDRAAARPVPSACIHPLTLTAGGIGERGKCSEDDGTVQTQPLAPGTYTLFVQAPYDGTYGHQWVGRAGGTGDQRTAAKITVRAGQVTDAPLVKLDLAGTISGTVTTADGKPANGGSVSYSAWDYRVGQTHGTHIDSKGRYELAELGPYEWPLVITADQALRQFTGGTGNRFRAAKVKVNAGATTAYDVRLRPGSVLRGTVLRSGGRVEPGWLTAVNAVTGDPIADAPIEADGSYRMPVLGDQVVKLKYVPQGSESIVGWHNGAADQAHARPVRLPSTGERVLNINIR